MIKEFREFILRGNVVDMAVGIVIGLAFGRIVTSLVEDIIMPPVGLLLGKVDFSSLYVNLSDIPYPSYEAAAAAGAPMIRYGIFLNQVISFLILALAVFLLVKAINRLRRPAEEVCSEKTCPYCQTCIPVAATRCPQCTSQLD